MGITPPMKGLALWTVALALCAIAHGVDEVESMEASGGKELNLQEGTETGVEFLQMTAQSVGAPADVVGLTSEIKDLQSDISDIKKRKENSSATSQAAVKSAAVAAPGAEQDKHMANHIDQGAKEQDLDAEQKQKEQKLVQKTIQQHEAAKKIAVQDAGSSSSADASGTSADASGYQGALDQAAAASGYGTGDASVLFDTWTGDFDSAHAKLAEEAKRLAGMVASKIQSQRQNVKHHMEVVKKAYEKETTARKAAQQKAKEFQQKEISAKGTEKKAKASEAATKKKMEEAIQKSRERQSKAVEKKQKQVEIHERKAKQLEKRVKAIHPSNCGAIKEKEKKAKEEIRRLHAENKKIRDSCEQRSKEMAKKAEERLTKANEKTAKQKTHADKLAAELQAAREKITSLQQQLAAARQKIQELQTTLEEQRKETQKQIALKKAEEQAKKGFMEKHQKAEAKVRKLQAQLKAVIAKFTKLKETMRHINTVSVTPDKMQQA